MVYCQMKEKHWRANQYLMNDTTNTFDLFEKVRWFFSIFNTIAVIINENYTLMAALKTYILDEKMDNCCYAKEIKNTKIAKKKTPNDDSEKQTFLFKENIFSSEIIILFGDVFGGFFHKYFPLGYISCF